MRPRLAAAAAVAALLLAVLAHLLPPGVGLPLYIGLCVCGMWLVGAACRVPEPERKAETR